MTVSVSVVMPVYNSEKYLEETLKSIFSQTFQDFEIIAVDDGSTDKTKDILLSFDKNIKYIYQKNSGPSSARNNGIRNSIGKYIAFIDSDDIWNNKKLEKQMLFFLENPKYDFLFTNYIAIDNRGNEIIKKDFKRVLDGKTLFKDLLFYNAMSGCTSSSIIKKECIDTIGYFDETMKLGCEDREMWLRVAKKLNVQVIQEYLMKYRYHSGNMHKNIKNMMAAQKQFYKNNKKFMSVIDKRKFYSQHYLDASHEYRKKDNHYLSIIYLIKSIVYYPKKTYSKDDKYKIMAKFLIPNFLKNFL